MPSRQRAWQVKMRAQGRCMNCGKPVARKGGGYCLEHLKKAREIMRKRIGGKPWSEGSTGLPPLELREQYIQDEEEKLEAALQMLNDGYNVREVAEAMGVKQAWITYRVKMLKIWVPKESEERYKATEKKAPSNQGNWK